MADTRRLIDDIKNTEGALTDQEQRSRIVGREGHVNERDSGFTLGDKVVIDHREVGPE